MDRDDIQNKTSQEILGEKLQSLLSFPTNKSKKMRICMAGIPGSGKTTIAQLLADRLKGVYMPEFMEQLPKHVLDMRADSTTEEQILAQQWILSQYKKKAELIKKMPDDSVIVQDRGVIDCLAYSAVCKPKVLDVIRSESETFEWPSDFTILLIADDANVKSRMIAREKFNAQFFDTNWRKYIQDLREKYILISQELHTPIIDTSNKSSETTVTNLLSMLSK